MFVLIRCSCKINLATFERQKTDPAVIVIDDKAQFVISTLSGHLGGANQLTNDIANQLGATPVITTAADVNKTIAVDLVGKDFGWKIDDDSNVTRISAFMVKRRKNWCVPKLWKKKIGGKISCQKMFQFIQHLRN